ncbi:Alpha/Beta hydrolase protein [Aspergillus pseudoustus]|uniref:Alpha/Beta hydrolase protein n=1 Tax=Aspergillus pseudoustus TaxID=1810923 RepID=A0ABR4IHL9_9EURO
MPDYSQYQGPSAEWETFVEKNPLPAGNFTIPPQTIRQNTNALRIKLAQTELAAESLHDAVHWRDHCILTRDNQNILARIYTPKSNPNQVSSSETPLPVYLYFHGGGHLFGTIETEDAACSRLAAHANLIVVNVNYRHTPEFTHPTQVNDAWDALIWLSRNAALLNANPNRVIVGGISAGAGLAASVVLQHHTMCRHGKDSVPLTVLGQLLCIPWLVHPDNYQLSTQAGSSYAQNVDAPVLSKTLLRLFTDLLGAADPSDPTLNVGLVGDGGVVGLPKSAFLVAGRDLLRDEGLDYAEKLTENEVPTKVHVFPGLPHGFRRFSALASSRVWDELLVESCQWILSESQASSFDVVDTNNV